MQSRKDKWNQRLLSGENWVTRIFWNFIYFLGRVFSLGTWNPFSSESPSTPNTQLDNPRITKTKPSINSTQQQSSAPAPNREFAPLKYIRTLLSLGKNPKNQDELSYADVMCVSAYKPLAYKACVISLI